MDAPFPPLPPAAPRRVLVIGAGMSGLAAAWTLQRAGHEVVVVEARPRLGGRVLTMRDASGSAIAEAGAGRIPASHAWTMQWVERLGLQTEPLHPEAGLHPVAYAHGKRIVLSPGEDLARHFDLTEAEKALGFDALAEAHLNAGVERVRAAGGLDAPGWPPDSLADLDSLNVREHFARRGLSEAAIDLLLLGPFPQSISPLTVSRLLLSYDRARVVKIRGGNDRLPEKLAAQIKTPIALGAVVRAIRQNADGLEASLETNGRLEQIFADAAILTVPFSLIGEIAFSPALSPQKQRVIAELGYVAVTKVALKTRSRFWEREGLSGFAQLDTTAEIWSPRRHDQGETGVLQLYQQGEPARAMDAMDAAGRVEFATGVIERVFPGARAEVEESFEHSWMRDPFARGAYGGRTPGQNFLLRDHGATPEGRLFFAGEHLSLEYPGWIEGALRTGYRAAAEVNEVARP